MIRSAAESDLPRITAIYGEAVRHGTASFETEPPDLAEMTRRFRELVSHGFPYIVAEASGTVAGYAYAGPYRPRYAYRFTVESSVYVDPAFAARGLGRALMEGVIARAEAAGFRQMLAVIGDETNTASRALHARLGFREVGTFGAVGYKHGRWLGTVLMQRALGSGDATEPA